MSVAIGRLHIFVFLLRGVEFEAPLSGHQRNLVYTNNWYNLAAKIGISRGTGMQLDQLRCFVTAAEELHFGRAAQRLGMLPSALGRFIRLLEQELGTRLFLRTTRNVALTEPGKLLLTDARKLLGQVDALQTRIKAAARQQTTTIRVGAIDTAALGLLPLLLNDYQRECPDVKVDVLEDKTPRLLQRVLSGRLDFAFVRPPLSRDRNLEFRHLFYETAIVAVPTRWELARIERVSIKDIARQPLIVPDKRTRPHSHNLTIKLFTDARIEPQIAQVADEKQTIVNLVSAGLGIAILPRWTSRMKVRGVTYIPLRASKRATRNLLPLAAAWVRGSRDPLRASLLKVLNTNIDRYSAGA
jgi:DNA-binding transcriptional LysR family regulator